MQNKWIVAGLALGLYGCGGGGGDSPAPVTPELPQYQVSTQAGNGGSLSPASALVRQGQTTSFSVLPAAGFAIDSVSGCGGSLSGSTYTTGAVSAACTVTASFKSQSLLLVAKAGAGGSVMPAEQRVNYGAKAEWSVKANSGYQIDSVTGCGGSLNAGVYTVASVTAACEVNASFSKLSYTVTASSNSGGIISPASQRVAYGDTASLSLKADSGFVVGSVQGCGGQLQGDSYRTGPVSADCKVEAQFAPAQLQVTTAAGPGGRFLQQNPQVKFGEVLQLTLVPDSGFDITTASGCGGKLQGAVFTTAPVTAACTVSATFHVNTQVVFPDAALDAAVRQALSLSAEAPISKAQLATLTSLSAEAVRISDLQGLQYASGLKFLSVQNNQITDLTPLQGLSQLQDLQLGYNPLGSLQPLSGLKNLRKLWLFDAPATDLTPLRGLQLTELGLSHKAVLDLTPLRDMPLQLFYLWHSATTDLSPLANAPLQYLDVQYSKVQDLAVLKNLRELWGLNVSGTEVTDLSVLLQAQRLSSLSLLQTRLQNLDLLATLPLVQRASLDISGCIDQRGYSRHLEQLRALQSKYSLNLTLGPEQRTDCIDTLAGTQFSVQAEVIDRTLQYRWQISGDSSAMQCALYLDQDDQQPGTSAVPLQACAASGSQTFAGYQADQFRPALWFDNGIGGEKLLKLDEVGAAPATPKLQSLDLSQITLSAKPLLVAERDALLRLHVTVAQSPLLLPQFQLELQLNGTQQRLTATAPKKLPVSKVHRSLTDAYQAVIPAAWMKPGLQIAVFQDGQLVRSYSPQFAAARPLAIRIVPIQLGEQVAKLPDVTAVQTAVKTFWPFSQVEVRSRAPYQLKAGGVKSSAYQMLPEISDLRAIEGEGVYYYGYFKPEMGDGCCGGLGYIGFPVAVGFDTDDGEILAHELGHNFGRQHVGCGGAAGPDPAYPYPVSSMGSVGLDFALNGWMSPDDHSDLMSYCSPKHVSDYNVAAVQEFVQKNPPAGFSPTAALAQGQMAQASTGTALYLAGTLQGNALQIRTLVPLSRPPRQTGASAQVLRVLNQQGSWFEFNLQLQQIDHQPDTAARQFSVELPDMDIRRLEIWQSGVLLAVQDMGNAAAAGTVQQLSASQIQLDESANQLCVQWPAGQAATLTVLYQLAGQDTVLALNETAGQFCRDSSALPAGGDWRLIWRQHLSVRQFRQPR